MLGWSSKQRIRRQRARKQRAKALTAVRAPLISRVLSWPVLVGIVFVGAAGTIAVWGDSAMAYWVGQRVEHSIHAVVDFSVADPEQTDANRQAARAATPSYYKLNPGALTFDKIRAELIRVYETAGASSTFDEFQTSLVESNLSVEEPAFHRLRELVEKPEDRGRRQFQDWVESLPLENEHVVRSLANEARHPKSTTKFVILERTDDTDAIRQVEIPYAELVDQGNDKALHGSAADATRRFPSYELRPLVEAVVLATFREQPTLVFEQERTAEAMRHAEDDVPLATSSYDRGEILVKAGVLRSEDYELLRAHRAAYNNFLADDAPESEPLRQELFSRRVGLVTLVGVLCVGLIVYTYTHQPRIFENRARTLAFCGLILATLLASRILTIRWGELPELTIGPCLVAGSILAIVYPRRFALGAMAVATLLVVTVVGGNLLLLLTLFTGATVCVYQLDEIRTRTKLISAGFATAVAVAVVSGAGGLARAHSPNAIMEHAMWAGGCALAAAMFVSGVLPFIERTFRIATSLTLLEWRDPTRELLQLLAREAPGTYNHSLVSGSLAEAGCNAIGANGLLAQVGALYHDIGKIPKASYFAENQAGGISRHENLAPTMSLLIILGHVKDGVEMAKEYKLPRVLIQFIEEHHGTTVVRYFHHMASEQQPRIASGKHDREVPEAEFRYGGPKPRTRESAVLMLSDGVEGAVRALQDPTVGRIESVVHQIVSDRLADEQFSACDITMKEIHLVEEALAKTLCAIYHGRVAYPKQTKTADHSAQQAKKVSV